MTLFEELNFLVTNRIPRRSLTLFMGWASKLQHPALRVPSIALWRLFCDVDLSDAARSRFSSLHDAFTRELRPGARQVDNDPQILTSPSDGVVMATGVVSDDTLLQAKGLDYRLSELLGDSVLAAQHQGSRYITLRLTAGMYHRFHAPADCHVSKVTYISGDTWNVNPPALQRIERLYCRNERAVIETTLAGAGLAVTLVPVAAVLVASIRLHFANVLLHLRYRGPNVIDCDANLQKGQEMGWFEHGSTIILLLPAGCALAEGITAGTGVRMGQALVRLP
jgi:phosphatidylserine decarboxylase